MDDDEIAAIVADAKAKASAENPYKGVADDGFEIARATLAVLGKRLGLSFVLDVQREVLAQADRWSKHEDAERRADAIDIAAVANAGYFTDLIGELSDGVPSGRA